LFSGLGPEKTYQRTVVQSPLPDPNRIVGGRRNSSPWRGHHHRLPWAVNQTGHGHVTVVRNDIASIHPSKRIRKNKLY